MKDVVVLVGTGSIGQAIARRVGAGKHIVLGDLKLEAANAAAKIFDKPPECFKFVHSESARHMA